MFEVEALSVTRSVANRQQVIVDGLRFKVAFGRTVAVVSESFDATAALGLALQGLTVHKDDRIAGTIRIDGTGIRISDEQQMELRRGGDIGFMSLGATKKTVVDLLTETFLLENHVDKREARRQIIFLLESLGFEDVTDLLGKQVSTLSTLDQRRVQLANAICNGPRALIIEDALADIEPTQRLGLLRLIERIRDSLNCAVVWLTHSLAESVMYADEIVVLHAGRVVESGSRSDIFLRPEMPYTVSLLAATPSVTGRLGAHPSIASSEPSSSGCTFAHACGRATLVEGNQCATSVPVLATSTIGHEVRCHLPAGMRVRFARQMLGGES